MTKDEIVRRWGARVHGTTPVEFELDIKAVSKERPRAARTGHFYTPAKTVKYEKAIADYARSVIEEPFTEPLLVDIAIGELVPKGWSEDKKRLALDHLILPTKRDLDNQEKAITDALNGIAYIDDAQIRDIHAMSFYSYKNFVRVILKPIALGPQQIEQALYSMKNAKADKWRQASS